MKVIKMTKEVLQDRINKFYDGNYTILGDYRSPNMKCLIKCNRCGRIYLAKPKKLLNLKGGLCPDCNSYDDKYNVSYDAFIYRLKIIYGKKVKYKSGYNINGNNSKSTVITLSINGEYSEYDANYQLKDIIWKPKNITKAEKYDKYIDDNFFLTYVLYSVNESDNYEWLEPYKGKINIPHKIRHRIDNCKSEFEISPEEFLSGKRCPNCNMLKTFDDYRDVINDALNSMSYIKLDINKNYVVRNSHVTLPKWLDFYVPSKNLSIKLVQHIPVGNRYNTDMISNNIKSSYTFFETAGYRPIYISELDLMTRKEVLLDYLRKEIFDNNFIKGDLLKYESDVRTVMYNPSVVKPNMLFIRFNNINWTATSFYDNNCIEFRRSKSDEVIASMEYHFEGESIVITKYTECLKPITILDDSRFLNIFDALVKEIIKYDFEKEDRNNVSVYIVLDREYVYFEKWYKRGFTEVRETPECSQENYKFKKFYINKKNLGRSFNLGRRTLNDVYESTTMGEVIFMKIYNVE